MSSKKGMSAVVISLIIVSISIIAVGIIWAIIQNIINSQEREIGLTSKCLSINLDIESVNCVTDSNDLDNCTVILRRTGTSTDEIAGVKLHFVNEAGAESSEVIEAVGNIETLGSSIVPVETGISGVEKVEATVYFTDSSDREQICSNTDVFEF